MADSISPKILNRSCLALPKIDVLSSDYLYVKKTYHGNPQPLDFDAYFPWLCLERCTPNAVTITRIQDPCVRPNFGRRASIKSGKSSQGKTTGLNSISTGKTGHESTEVPMSFDNGEPAIPVKTHYDARGRLIEVFIEKCPIDINSIIIQAFSECLPFHSSLYKFTIRSKGVSAVILREIGKMLPYSYLTDICLDGVEVPEGNYYVLLERESPLKTLSLNRCGIDDVKCKKLAVNMDFGKPSALLTLELGSNHISDAGAQALGDMLRRNRQLLHLNLSGNMITDTGAAFILNHLIEFPLTCDDILLMRRNRMNYDRRKIIVYEQCLKDVASEKRSTARLTVTSFSKRIKTFGPSKPKGTKRSKKTRAVTSNTLSVPPVMEDLRSNEDLANNMTKEILGEYSDPFGSKSVLKRNGYYYCTGNMVLCSLNLAYNHLEYQSVKKIHHLLQYQQLLKSNNISPTGLLRIVIEGNLVPKSCLEYIAISMFINKSINDLAPKIMKTSSHRKRYSSFSTTRRSRVSYA